MYKVCVRSYDQKPYLHNEIKGGICIKIEFNPQKNISLLQDGRRFFAYSSNMAAMTSCEHTLYLKFMLNMLSLLKELQMWLPDFLNWVQTISKVHAKRKQEIPRYGFLLS